MNASQMLIRLREYGLTDSRIAAELGVCQSSVNKIRRGIIKNPLYSTVRGIESLYHLFLFKDAHLDKEISDENQHVNS